MRSLWRTAGLLYLFRLLDQGVLFSSVAAPTSTANGDARTRGRKEKVCGIRLADTAHKLTSFLSPFDGANAASAAGVPGCGVSPPYMLLYVTPLSVPLYVIYYYIAWRAFLFGLRTGYVTCGTKASARRTNHLIFRSFCGRSPYELDTQNSTFVSCSSGWVLRCSGCGTV